MSGKARQGWWWPDNARKAHYFAPDGRSLCGKWLALHSNFDDGIWQSPDDCAACARKAHALANQKGQDHE